MLPWSTSRTWKVPPGIPWSGMQGVGTSAWSMIDRTTADHGISAQTKKKWRWMLVMNVQLEGMKRPGSLIYAAGVRCFECRECLVYNFSECRESYLDERALAGGEWRPAYTYRGGVVLAWLRATLVRSLLCCVLCIRVRMVGDGWFFLNNIF